MKNIFFIYKSGQIARRDNSLALITQSETIPIPIEQVDTIVFYSEVSFNKRLLEILNKYKIEALFYNHYGGYIGKFVPKEYKDGKILVMQALAYNDELKRLYIARQITYYSMKNMLTLAKYYRKKGKGLDSQIDKMEAYLEETKKVASVDKLLLVEARFKNVYYSIFDVVLADEKYKFDKRTVRPPLNEVNAIMSYGYSLLYGIILSIIDRSDLSPHISFIHSLSKSNDSLQLDLADIYKPVIIDRIMLRIIRKRQIDDDCFEYGEESRCYLNEKGTKLFIKEFNQLLKKTVEYHGKSYTYKTMLYREVNELSEYIKGDLKDLKFFEMQW